MRFTSEKGFTLVELSISMVVIGLLLGGVLKGRELIENSRIASTIAQIKTYDAATSTFRDTYGTLPGDLKNPSLRLPDCNTYVCNLGGNENGKIDWTFDTSPSGEDFAEAFNFFPHLTKAGLINGPVGGSSITSGMYPPTKNSDPHVDFSPRQPLRNLWAVYPVFANPARGAAFTAPFTGFQNIHYYSLFSFKVKQADMFDQKLDDGNAHTGDVLLYETAAPCADTDGRYRAFAEGSVWQPVTTTTWHLECRLWMQTAF